jgi:hypothetical protein
VTAHDFLPLAPTAPLTALRLLSGAGAPAELRSRPLRGVPRARCWRVGAVLPALLQPRGSNDDAAAVAAAVAAFDAQWPRLLQLRSRDCRHHAAALALALTGVPDAMARDPRSQR